MRTQAGTCSECSKRMLKAAKFCASCGTSASEPEGPPRLPPGWYDDPADSTNKRFWDGSTWTDHRATERSAVVAVGGIPIAPIAVILGGALVSIGSFLPWAKITAPFVGTITKAGTEGDGVVTLGVGVALALLGLALINRRATSWARVGSALLAASAAALIVVEVVDLKKRFAGINDRISQVDADVSVVTSYGAGLWVVAVGAIVSFVGALAARPPDRRWAAPTSSPEQIAAIDEVLRRPNARS